MGASQIVRVTAEGGFGMSRQVLRGPGWAAPFHGVRIQSADANDLRVRCRALLRVAPPGSVISGRTAARLRRWWLARRGVGEPITITVAPGSLLRRPGVVCHRAALTADDVTLLDGIPITTPVRTLFDLATDLSLVDLVVAADAALSMGDCRLDELVALARTPGRRGAPKVRRILPLLEPKSESPMETLLRLVVVLSGLPRPQAQVELCNEWGSVIARSDLLASGGRAVFEFDGQEHDAPKRHAGDVRRWRALREAGFEVYPYTAVDLFQNPQQIVTDYQRAIGVPVDPTAVIGWLTEWRLSDFVRADRRSR